MPSYRTGPIRVISGVASIGWRAAMDRVTLCADAFFRISSTRASAHPRRFLRHRRGLGRRLVGLSRRPPLGLRYVSRKVFPTQSNDDTGSNHRHGDRPWGQVPSRSVRRGTRQSARARGVWRRAVSETDDVTHRATTNRERTVDSRLGRTSQSAVERVPPRRSPSTRRNVKRQREDFSPVGVWHVIGKRHTRNFVPPRVFTASGASLSAYSRSEGFSA